MFGKLLLLKTKLQNHELKFTFKLAKITNILNSRRKPLKYNYNFVVNLLNARVLCELFSWKITKCTIIMIFNPLMKNQKMCHMIHIFCCIMWHPHWNSIISQYFFTNYQKAFGIKLYFSVLDFKLQGLGGNILYFKIISIHCSSHAWVENRTRIHYQITKNNYNYKWFNWYPLSNKHLYM